MAAGRAVCQAHRGADSPMAVVSPLPVTYRSPCAHPDIPTSGERSRSQRIPLFQPCEAPGDIPAASCFWAAKPPRLLAGYLSLEDPIASIPPCQSLPFRARSAWPGLKGVTGPLSWVSARVFHRLLKPSIIFPPPYPPEAGDERLTDSPEQAGMSHSGWIDT